MGITVTPALRPFVILCATLCLIIQQPHILNTVQYIADGDVGKVTRFQEMMTQVPNRNTASASQS